MWVGFVLTCFVGTEIYNTDNCVLYQSPTIIEGTVENCVDSVNQFIAGDSFNMFLDAAGLEIYNVQCIDLTIADAIKV